jgi:hypothetical protein
MVVMSHRRTVLTLVNRIDYTKVSRERLRKYEDLRKKEAIDIGDNETRHGERSK